MHDPPNPLPTVFKLEAESGATWSGYRSCIANTAKAEVLLGSAITDLAPGPRVLGASSSLILCGSFARYEMVDNSDCDWTLLIDGPASNQHADEARFIDDAIRETKGLRHPGASGTFGNMCFSHDLVHRIGGGADSNQNLTRRILMLLESRPMSFSGADQSGRVWSRVLRCILQRYFEEEAHFNPAGERKVPRFFLNDLTRYWRTIGVDYASKYRDQAGQNWALRNAKLRLSRKLLFASGLAFCFRCQLQPPEQWGETLFGRQFDRSADPFIDAATAFAMTPPLEVLAQFIDNLITDPERRRVIAGSIFGAYNDWLLFLDDPEKRKHLEELGHDAAKTDPGFGEVREIGKEFASGLKTLFFGKEHDHDPIANLSLEYVGF